MAYSFPSLDLTNEWPTGVTNRDAASGVPPGVSDPSIGDSTISELVAEIKPRYHIAGGMGVYYDREPYANVGAVHVTRFIALAPVGNKDKQKYIHALSPTPASKMSSAELCTKPPNTTSSPYSFAEETGSGNGAIKRSGDSVSDTQYWRYDVSQKRQKHGDGEGAGLCFKFVSSGSCPRGEKCHFRHDADAREQSIRGVCFDFLNKGKCERGPDCKFKHSIQEEGQGFSSRSAGSANSLQTYFKRQGKEVVFFEWVSKRGTHANLQVLAGLLNIADKADWRNCQLSKEEETKMAADFKTRFIGRQQFISSSKERTPAWWHPDIKNALIPGIKIELC
ncbi:UNVERIFIED_CONTAM: Zinc finger CCCH domain-containing protein 64 [Sesamum radiatum]|uniref:Zinc finger CCCH domain-containing protein 64 n=1 Tax=Sesamum radiatum TaxID=300843 RepID=A0AAW2NRA8_SESRA